MAVNEGIRSPFTTQPSALSPKLRIYERLYLLNQGIDHVVALLRDMEKFPFADKESVQSAVAEIEEAHRRVLILHLGDRVATVRCGLEGVAHALAGDAGHRRQ